MIFEVVAASLTQNSPRDADLSLSSILDFLQGTESDIQSKKAAKELNVFLSDPRQTLKSIKKTGITDDTFSTSGLVIYLPTQSVIIIES